MDKKYDNIVLPDKNLKEIRAKFGDIWQNSLQNIIDYLNWDKYLLVQSILKTVNKDNFEQISVYLDWALWRIDWLIHTLGKYIKKDWNIDKDIID